MAELIGGRMLELLAVQMVVFTLLAGLASVLRVRGRFPLRAALAFGVCGVTWTALGFSSTVVLTMAATGKWGDDDPATRVQRALEGGWLAIHLALAASLPVIAAAGVLVVSWWRCRPKPSPS